MVVVVVLLLIDFVFEGVAADASTATPATARPTVRAMTVRDVRRTATSRPPGKSEQDGSWRSKQTSSATQTPASADSDASGSVATPELLGGGAEDEGEDDEGGDAEGDEPEDGEDEPEGAEGHGGVAGRPGHPAGHHRRRDALTQPQDDAHDPLDPDGRLGRSRVVAGALLAQPDLADQVDGVAAGHVLGLAPAGVDVVPRLLVGVGAVDAVPAQPAAGGGGVGGRREADGHRPEPQHHEEDAGDPDDRRGSADRLGRLVIRHRREGTRATPGSRCFG